MKICAECNRRKSNSEFIHKHKEVDVCIACRRIVKAKPEPIKEPEQIVEVEEIEVEAIAVKDISKPVAVETKEEGKPEKKLGFADKVKSLLGR